MYDDDDHVGQYDLFSIDLSGFVFMFIGAYGRRYYIILRLPVKWIHDRLTLRVDGTTTYKRSRIDNNKEIITRDLARAVYSLSGVFSRQVRV